MNNNTCTHYTGPLADDIAESCLKLQIHFATHANYIGPLTIQALQLPMTAQTLVNLGVLVAGGVGRWDDGFKPGPYLTGYSGATRRAPLSLSPQRGEGRGEG